MASQSLYRKWRSQKFADLIGQEPIIRTLKNALSSGKPAHAYIFTGPRGTGKTSTARLLAKTINCTNPQNGEPCNTCQQCREITAGNSFNVIEIDAASNRGIDSIRDLREKVMMPPATGTYKVYVLDEAHMLTPEACNALLKTLEEPPSYAIFILATTDVHKMLSTVLSRCQRFDFKRITTRQIVAHLHFVAGQEQIKLESAAAELIARTAAGGMRDALSLLDQAGAYCGEEISLAQVQTMLGVADPRAIHKLIMHAANVDSSGGLHLIHELSEAGADLRQINAQVVEYWRALMLAKGGADVATVLDLTEDEIRDVVQIAQLFGLEELIEYARIFALNDLMQKNQGTPQLGLEIAFLACVERHRHAQGSQGVPARGTPTLVKDAVAGSTEIASEGVPARGTPTSVKDAAQPLLTAENVGRVADEESLTIQGDGAQPLLTVQRVKNAWDKVAKRMKQKSPSTAAMLKYYDVVAVEGVAEQTVVVVQAQKQGHYNYLNEQDRAKDVEWALTMEFGQKCGVRLVPPGQVRESTGVGASPTPTQSTSDVVNSLRETSTHSASAAAAIGLQGSAHLERSPLLSSVPSEEVEQGSPPLRVQEERLSYADSPDVVALARNDMVSENATMVTPQETLEQQAHRDPIVQEVIKMFAARIVDVRPK